MRRSALSLLLLLCIAGDLPGKDKWSKKSYLEWTEEEALQVLTDSPWSKTWSSAAARRPGAEAAMPSIEAEESGQHSNCCRTFGSGIGAKAADPRNTKGIVAGGQTEPSSGLPGESFRIAWFSSMRFRQALYRLRLINGAERDPAAESQLVQPADQIVVAVSGPSMRRFWGASLEALRPTTRLQSKKNKDRVAELIGFVAPETRPDSLALFVFSRYTDDRPVFDQTDKGVVFSTGDQPTRISVVFQLSKMTADGILDY